MGAPSQTLRTIRGLVFTDLDRDGFRAPSEAVVTGAFVTVVLPDGTRRTTVSDSDGRYELFDIPDGRLSVEVLSNGLTQRWLAEVLGTTPRLDVPFATEPLTLAFTGRRAQTEAAFGMLSLGLGCALLLIGRRRRTTSTTP